MSTALCVLAGCFAIVGVIATGAYLVMHDHLWVGVLVIIIGASINVKTGSAATKEP
jgi:hypothetical protein